MSLGKYKIKSEIYSDIFTTEWEILSNYDDLDYYYPYDWEWCYNSCCWPEYEVENKVYVERVRRKGSLIRLKIQLIGEFIDMCSIYKRGSINYRDLIISKILDEDIKNTLGDYINYK